MKERKKHVLKFLWKVTAREFSRGQFLWIGLCVQMLLILFVSSLAELGLAESARVYDTFSYFFSTTLGLFVASLLGAFCWARDHSKTGLCEILCGRQRTAAQVFIMRFFCFALCLNLFQLSLYIFHAVALGWFYPERFSVPVIASMIAGGSLYISLSLAVAMTLSTVIRPALAFLSTLLLFSLGTLTEALTHVSHLGAAASEDNLGPLAQALSSLFSWWKPQILIVSQSRGDWVPFEATTIAFNAAWTLSCVSAFLFFGAWVAQRAQKVERWSS